MAHSIEPADPALSDLTETARRVRRGARRLARQNAAVKDDALRAMAHSLREQQSDILEANGQDLIQAREKGLDPAFIDRLVLDASRIDIMAQALEEVIALPDPVGGFDEIWVRPNGLKVGKKRIPLGVIGIIYESRPNVTSDAAALCLKSGNGVLLKGGSDAFHSNRAVFEALRAGLEQSSLPEAAHDAIGFVQTTRRDAVRHMLGLSAEIDVIIPRGGKGLISFVTEHSRIPVIKHDEGICHLVIEGSARADDVDAVALNSKTQRPGVCNTIETMLVLDNAVVPHLGRLLKKLAGAGVGLHLCERSMELAKSVGLDASTFTAATEEDFETEYLALELTVRIVEDLDEAIAHIDRYGSQHTESLLTQDYASSQRFIDEVDSSVVMINASTRFSDGNQLGLGAEIGISTTRMHAYGPMGLKELTTTKFVVLGDGQIRP
ncbi:MAG: glutamate-5-semialdehyde dehydrogenase [Bradymonadaceae bacterium]